MRKFVMTAAAVMAIVGATASSAVAARPPTGTGQPGVATTSGANCATQPMQPTGFAGSGFTFATTVYANPGTTPGNQTHAISEYDIACFEFSSSHS
jgi:hypothetical protein